MGTFVQVGHILGILPFYSQFFSCQVHIWDRWFQSPRSYPRAGTRPRIFQSSSCCIETKSIKLAKLKYRTILVLMYNFQNCFEKFNWNIKAYFTLFVHTKLYPFYYFPIKTNKEQFPVLTQKIQKKSFRHFRAAVRRGAWRTRWSSTTARPATPGWSWWPSSPRRRPCSVTMTWSRRSTTSRSWTQRTRRQKWRTET